MVEEAICYYIINRDSLPVFLGYILGYIGYEGLEFILIS